MQVTRTQLNTALQYAYNIYHYGSYVYGTYIPGKSDMDFIVIVPDEMNTLDHAQWECENEQYTFYSAATWRHMLNEHDVCAVEVTMLPGTMKIKEECPFIFELDANKLRASFSRTASNSWVKCKKKLIVPEDFAPRIGKKSLWHALRILDFGIQIMQTGHIFDFSSTNHLYDEIANCPSDDWQYYKERYQQIYNHRKSQFRAFDAQCHN